nr:amidase family protein [Bradyrhizobium sp. BRP22]
MLFSVVAGFDRRDPFSVAGPVPDVIAALAQPVAGMRVVYSPTLGYARPNAEVLKLTDRAAETLGTLGCQVDLVEKVFDADPADLWTAEFYAGVGIRLRSFMEDQRELLDAAVADVLEPALIQDMRDYYAKVFSRYALRDTVRGFFERYDVLISPVLPVTSLEVSKNIPDELPDRNLVSWVYFTYPFNLSGQPAASVCAGVAADGMPVGLQIVGRSHSEHDVVRLAAAFERTQIPGYNVRNYPI